MAEPELLFFPFRLDSSQSCLWRDAEKIPLMPKDFAVLHYLATHPGKLVRQEELLRAVWPDVVIAPGVVKVCLRRIRRALGDSPTTPRFIQTLHRRGYRFIAPLASTPPVASSQYSVVSRKEEARNGGRETDPSSLRASSLQPPASSLVGRDAELAQLHDWFDKALRGERQFVFVTGELGIGKTTIIRMFLERIAVGRGVAIGRGQCIEHYGSGEAYLPVLEAFERLGRDAEGWRFLELMRQYAPTWLGQLPSLVPPHERAILRQSMGNPIPARMLREMATALERLTDERPLVLYLEDLHWSDSSTIELLAALARRREPARLMIIGAYRSMTMITDGHPLKGMIQELQGHHLCQTLPLKALTEAHTTAYLDARFVPNTFPARLARILYQRTEGNPLFLVNIVDDLVNRHILSRSETQWILQESLATVEANVPEELRQLIIGQCQRLSPEDQQLLESASIAGREFTTEVVAAALAINVVEVERLCQQFAQRQQFLRRMGVSEWPDGSVTERYGFLHALYQQVWQEHVGAHRRQQLHLRIGERLERAYGEQAREIAAELAVHFERGGDYRRAIFYVRQAGENAQQRAAHQEAIKHFSKGVRLLPFLPDSTDRARHELTFYISLGAALAMTKGYAALEVKDTYHHALTLSHQLNDATFSFPVLWRLWAFYFVCGDLPTARELGERLLALAAHQHTAELSMEARLAQGAVLLRLGDLPAARTYLEQGARLYCPQYHASHALLYGQDPQVACLADTAYALWFLGFPDQAQAKARDALEVAKALTHPFSLAFAAIFTAMVSQLCGQEQEAQDHLELALTLSTAHEFPNWQATSMIVNGWVLTQQGQITKGIEQLRSGLKIRQAIGAELTTPYWLVLLAEAYAQNKQRQDSQHILSEAFALTQKTKQHLYEAELYRLKGTLALQTETRDWKRETGFPSSQASRPKPLASSSVEQEAEADFLTAIKIARRQQARSLELRATMSLARLWRQQGKTRKAQLVLKKSYGWFTEGFDTKDLQEAKALLKELEH